MDQGKNFPQFENVLEIWKENIKSSFDLDYDVIVAHSFGCHFTLLNREKIKGKKIILVNPVVIKRNIFVLLWQWIKLRLKEDMPSGHRRIINPLKIIRGMKKALIFSRANTLSLLEEINNIDIVIIRGKNDLFFCDEKSAEFLRKIKIKLMEIDNVGHFWNEKIDEEIKKIIGK